MRSIKFSFVCLLCAWTNVSYGADDLLPLIKNVAPIPVQWEKGLRPSDLGENGTVVESALVDALQQTKRFTILNDQLVKNTWKGAGSRAQLVEEYEVSAFATLNVAPRGDTVAFTTRILSPKFAPWLQESELVSLDKLSLAPADAVRKRINDLVFRMVNRLPYDVYVTSVQGSFITLSGGSQQNINVGDSLPVLAAKITAVHPANGTWLMFDTTEVGKVKVVEVKPRSAIAKMESQLRSGAILAGQGIKLKDIDSRRVFAKSQGPDVYEVAKEPGSAVMSGVTTDGKKAKDEHHQPTVAVPKIAEAKPEGGDVPAAEHIAEESKEEVKPEEPSKPFVNKEQPVAMFAGLKMWSVSGEGSASARFPLWVVNTVGADMTSNLSPIANTHLNMGLELGYGPTGSGSFLGYGAHGDLLWKGDITSDMVRGWYAGPTLRLDGQRVSGESYVGSDLFRLGLMGGVHGHTVESADLMQMDPFADLTYYVLTFGRAQFEKSSGAASGTGWVLRAGAYFGDTVKTSGDKQWGGGFSFANDSLKAGDGKMDRSIVSFQGLLRVLL